MRETLAISIAVFVGYAGAALGLSNAFPFSTFPMYAEVAPTYAARLVVADAEGRHLEVVRFDEWVCEGELERSRVEVAMCPDGEIGHATPYLVQDALDYMRAHPGTPGGGEPVDLVVHVWRFDRTQIRELDCVVARCRAVRR